MKKPGIVVVVIAIVVLVGWLSVRNLGRLTASGEDPEPSALRYESIERRNIGSTVLATGVIRPRVGAEVQVGSRVSGILAELNVTIGDHVFAGSLLAKLDPTEFQARVDLARAQVETAVADREYAASELSRAQQMLEEAVITQAQIDAAERAFKTADARERQARASLESAEIQLGYTNITAPISGVVASVSTQVGETVAASFASPTFVTIIDLDRLEVWAYVDETDIGRVEVDQRAVFTVDTYMDTEFSGTVTAIQPAAEIIDNVVNYVTLIEIGPTGGKILRPEMTTSVNIILEGLEGVLAIPNGAVRRDSHGAYAFVVGPLGTAVTDNQLRLLWRMASEPVFCLDGDSAGRKAAYRAVETALPHLEPGKSARFVFLPDGQDPDDIVQDQGAEFFRQLLDRSQPLSEVLWQKEWEAGVWDTPERRADLEARLNAAVRTIQNGSVKSHYEADIRSRLFAAWRDSNRQRYDKKSDKTRNNRYGGRGQSVAGRQKNWNSSRAGNSLFQARNHLGGGASTSLTQSVLVKEQKLNASTTEALLISFLFHHPWLLDEFVEEISAIKIENSRIEQLRDAFLSIHAEHHPVDREVLNSQLSLRGLDAMLLQILQSIPGKSTLSDDCEAGSPEVRDAWHRLMNEIRRMSLARELDTAGKSMGYDISEEEIDRITNISRELQDLENR